MKSNGYYLLLSPIENDTLLIVRHSYYTFTCLHYEAERVELTIKQLTEEFGEKHVWVFTD